MSYAVQILQPGPLTGDFGYHWWRHHDGDPYRPIKFNSEEEAILSVTAAFPSIHPDLYRVVEVR